MGCTSSAPNMNNTTTAEKSIQFEEDFISERSNDVDEILYRAENNASINKTNVLPSCDNLAETLEIDRNTSSSNLKKDHLAEEYDLNDISNKHDTSNIDNPTDDIPKLQKIVETVVGCMHNNENIEEPPQLHEPDQGHEKAEVVSNETKEIKCDDKHPVTEAIENDAITETNEDPTESASPSQSESSRATRWEALADIAAELPPSLMVDPITGQIYALSK